MRGSPASTSGISPMSRFYAYGYPLRELAPVNPGPNTHTTYGGLQNRNASSILGTNRHVLP